jgi:hypothetical protein
LKFPKPENMKPYLASLAFFILICQIPGHAQQVIGLPKDEVVRVMHDEYKDFVPDNSSRNTSFKYLKYIDKLNEQTLLVMLSDNDVCTSVKLISDYMNLEEVVKDLNNKYKKAGDDSWYYFQNKQKLVVTLKKEEWFFTVLIKPEKK